MSTPERCETSTPLEIELLIPAHKRRVTVQDHADFREAIFGPTQARKSGEVERLNALLDQIAGSEVGS